MVESKVDLLVNGRRLFVVFMLLLLTVACAGALLSGAPLPGELAGWLLLFALVLLLAALTRLPNLGYGEYYDDELDVVQSARSLLLGQTNVIFEHRKGPTEIWFATVAAGTSTQFDETTTRLPFVLASL